MFSGRMIYGLEVDVQWLDTSEPGMGLKWRQEIEDGVGEELEGYLSGEETVNYILVSS